MTTAAVVGISHLMALGAALLVKLTAHFIWHQGLEKTFIVIDTLKVTAITSTREKCKWDSGLEAATMSTSLLMQIQAGLQCPGSSLKKWHVLNSKHEQLMK